jgi:hypothetical protein
MESIVSDQKSPCVFSGQNQSVVFSRTSSFKSIEAFYKRSFLLFALLTAGMLSACDNQLDSLPPDVGGQVKQLIEFEIAQARDYQGEIYNGSKATLNLTVSLENLLDGSNSILWDTVFSLRELKEFPSPGAPLVLAKEFSLGRDVNKALRVSKSIRYFDSNSNTWMVAKGEVVPRDRQIFKLEIGI